MTDTTADHLEILNLYALYTHSIDYNEGAAWVDCFTDDGIFERPRKKVTDSGREELTTFVEALIARKVNTERHVTTNIEVRVDGDKASGRAYLNVVVDATESETPHIRATGRYLDDLVRTPAGWRFLKRTLVHDGYMG